MVALLVVLLPAALEVSSSSMADVTPLVVGAARLAPPTDAPLTPLLSTPLDEGDDKGGCSDKEEEVEGGRGS